jgi:hypothetical protein
MFFLVGTAYDIKRYTWATDSLTFLIISNVVYGLLWPIAVIGQFFINKDKVAK